VTTTTTRPPPRPSPAGPRPAGKPRPEPAFLVEFRRLSALVPPGVWPATLPTEARASLDPKPLALGIGERVAALLPEAERPAFHLALGRFTRGRPYLLALSADGAMRWSDDGGRALGPVSEEHRASATAALLTRALRELKQQRPPKPRGAG
jgi:ProQ/FINO family